MPDVTIDSSSSGLNSSAGSAIHDLRYQHYKGVRTGAVGAWRALYRQGLRTMFGLGRPARFKAVPVFVLVVTVLPALAALSATSLSNGMVPLRYGRLIEQQIILFALFIAAQGPELLSSDQQYRVLSLILTRDVTRMSYTTARLAALFVAMFVVAIAPLMTLYVGSIGLDADPTAAFSRMGSQIWPVVAQSVLVALAVGGVGAAVSAWTPRRGYATAAIIALFIAASGVSAALRDVDASSRKFVELIDPIRSLHMQGLLLFEENDRVATEKARQAGAAGNRANARARARVNAQVPQLPLGTYALTSVAMGVLGGLILVFRVNRLQP